MSIISENIPPSNPPKKTIEKSKVKKKAKPVDFDDDSEPDDYELDNEDFEKELLKKKTKQFHENSSYNWKKTNI